MPRVEANGLGFDPGFRTEDNQILFVRSHMALELLLS
jgi:hypothetical protein